MRQVLGPGALGKPRGIRWRGRWEGGSGWGIHVTPWLIHVSVWQNPLQCCEVISLQLTKINEKKKRLQCLPYFCSIITWGSLTSSTKSQLAYRCDHISYVSYIWTYMSYIYIYIYVVIFHIDVGFPGGSDSKESACNAWDPRSLAGYSPWGHKELNTTEGLTLSYSS